MSVKSKARKARREAAKKHEERSVINVSKIERLRREGKTEAAEEAMLAEQMKVMKMISRALGEK